MIHPTLATLITKVHQIANRYGGRVWDNRVGDYWDAGQAVCAEAHGHDWQNSADFRAINAIPEDEPLPQRILDAADRVLAGTAWMERETARATPGGEGGDKA